MEPRTVPQPGCMAVHGREPVACGSRPVKLASRPASAPANGSAKRHAVELETLVQQALAQRHHHPITTVNRGRNEHVFPRWSS